MALSKSSGTGSWGFALALGIGIGIGIGSSMLALGQKYSAKKKTQPYDVREVKPKTMVVVDPFSTGAALSQMIIDRGYNCIRVISQAFPDAILNLIPKNVKNLSFVETIQHRGDVEETVLRLKQLPFDIVAIVPGSESGVELCDSLTSRFGLPSNSEQYSAARRNKYFMGERVREYGVRAVRQTVATRFEQVVEFISSLQLKTFKVVLKPPKSAGTDSVMFATSMDEAKDAFDAILGKENIFGHINTEVLIQEYLQGTEYVVDCVSLNGVHKVVAIWEYDKRPVNGAMFVYFGVKLYESETGEREERLSNYMKSVLDALEIRHGPSHGEVMWLDGEDTPCLVEVGARPHGGEGTFIDVVIPCIGYSQLDVMLNAIDDQEKFLSTPDRPLKLKAHAIEVCLVLRESGILCALPRLDEVRRFISFKGMEIKVNIGDEVTRTQDFITTPGSIMLCHKDRETVEREAEEIHKMEVHGFYDIKRFRKTSF